jgi:hypothetical protein
MAAKTAGTWMALDRIGVGDMSAVGTTLLYPLGTKVKARDTGTTAYGEGEFIYLEGVASTVRGSAVLITSDFATLLLATRHIGDVAVALGANAAAASYGWYQIFGKGVATCASGITDDLPLYIDTGGTVGLVDDTATAGDSITGMRSASTDDTATCVVYLNNPKVGDWDNSA